MEQFLSRIQSCDSACIPTKRLYCDLVWPFLLDSFFIVPLCICVIVVSVYWCICWSTAVETDCILLSTYFLRCHIGFWSLSWEKQERIVDPPKKAWQSVKALVLSEVRKGGICFSWRTSLTRAYVFILCQKEAAYHSLPLNTKLRVEVPSLNTRLTLNIIHMWCDPTT